jgi:hypothetical protein
MYYAQSNHFVNDKEQAKATLIGAIGMGLLSVMLIIAAVMSA